MDSISATIDADGPVRVKAGPDYFSEEADRIVKARQEREGRNQARLAREAEAQRRRDALTSPAERERIARDAKRRADRKAQKKATKTAALRR